MISTKDMYYKKAKKISFDKKERDKEKVVKYIVIHNTGNDGDSSKNNVDYFASWNDRAAGAHFFVDQKGVIGRSIPMNLTAWAVGDNGKGTLKDIVTNYNSVSIELCDIVKKEPSDAMIKSVVELIKYIRNYCPNVRAVVRHYDVTTKNCPQIMVDLNKWGAFLDKIGCCLVGIEKGTE